MFVCMYVCICMYVTFTILIQVVLQTLLMLLFWFSITHNFVIIIKYHFIILYYDYNLINNYILYFHKNPHKLARVLLHADIRTPTDKMMEELNWLKLDDRWKRQLLVVTFQCLKEIAPVYMSSYVTFTHSTHNRFTRNHSSNTLFIPSWNITADKCTFQYRAATNWNKVPVSVRSNFSDMSLKVLFNTILSFFLVFHFFLNYTCSYFFVC